MCISCLSDVKNMWLGVVVVGCLVLVGLALTVRGPDLNTSTSSLSRNPSLLSQHDVVTHTRTQTQNASGPEFEPEAKPESELESELESEPKPKP